jgi:hypothetical protein
MSFPDLVIWAGPVNAAQVPGATVADAVQKFLPCTGDGKAAGGASAQRCGDLAVSSGGRILPGILDRLGLREDEVGNIYLGAFSAGGHIWKRLLMSPEDRARIKGVMLHDAAYETGTSKSPLPTQGYVEFALDALKDPSKFMLMTASIGANPSTEKKGVYYQSGAETMRSTIDAINHRSNYAIQEAGMLPEGLPNPSRLWTAGKNLYFAQYDNVGHGGHANMAPLFWENLLQPWVSRVPGSGIEDGPSIFGLLVTVASCAGLGWYFQKWVEKKR